MALVARVWQRVGERVFEVRDTPLRGFHVEREPPEGARVAFALPEGRVVLRVASAGDFQAFVAGCAREATTGEKRFFDGDFEMDVEGSDLPPARGKRMVSFVRDGGRILHAWCEEGIFHSVWSPIELRMGLRVMLDELAALRQAGAAAGENSSSRQAP